MKILIRISSAVLLAFLTFGCSYGWCSSDPSATPTRRSCGGIPIAKPGGGYWTCTFDDEFDGHKLDTSQWTPQQTSNSAYVTGTPTSAACYVNSPNNVFVSGGYLNLTAREESALFACSYPGGSFTTQYTSGMVTTVYSFHQTYGRFEVRAKLPDTAVEGLQETLWLWPVNDTYYGAFPASGEIDFAEFYSEYAPWTFPTFTISTIHRQ